ncbi:UNVERIFIED_CONTAM: hypothetical protein K2H54_066729 [Gekko kuhli]
MFHERTHIGERRYKCSPCGRTYHCLIDFLLHQKSHAGEKPHRCALDCGQGSSQNAPLPPRQGAHLAEKFAFESGQEDEGLGVSAHEAQTQALLQQDPWVDDGELGPCGLPGEPEDATLPSVPAGDSGNYGATQDSAVAQGTVLVP